MSPSPLSNLTIVVVEDHDDARRCLGLFLDSLGATVVLARNGFEGLQATKDSRPNLVVSDIQMPEMNGFDLLRAIRAFRPDAGGNVPVIAMTAVVTNTDRARILNTGFQECLPKPFTPDKLGGGDSDGAQQLSLRFVHLKPTCAESAGPAQENPFQVQKRTYWLLSEPPDNLGALQ